MTQSLRARGTQRRSYSYTTTSGRGRSASTLRGDSSRVSSLKNSFTPMCLPASDSRRQQRCRRAACRRRPSAPACRSRPCWTRSPPRAVRRSVSSSVTIPSVNWCTISSFWGRSSCARGGRGTPTTWLMVSASVEPIAWPGDDARRHAPLRVERQPDVGLPEVGLERAHLVEEVRLARLDVEDQQRLARRAACR